MKRRFYITGVLAVGLLLGMAESQVDHFRILSSAQNFRQHFMELGGSQHSVSTLERFVLSLVLSGSPPRSTVQKQS